MNICETLIYPIFKKDVKLVKELTEVSGENLYFDDYKTIFLSLNLMSSGLK